MTEARARAASTIEVAVRPARLSGRFLRSTSDPYVAIDGTEVPVDWRRPCTFEVRPGTHRIAVFVRPRGLLGTLNARLGGTGGRGMLRVSVEPGARVSVLAWMGDAAADRFRLRVVDRL